MKVLLLEDVKTLGKKGQIINVSDGYAKNLLIPKKLASIATESTVNMVKVQNENKKKAELLERQRMLDLCKQIKGQEITISIKCGENGRLFGSVTTREIADELNNLGFNVDKRSVNLNEPIKQLGRYSVSAKLYANISADFFVSVVAE
ncbi:MAG: 50S ribosomal protein L9 [Clostridia bacterium]|nr:50S ribosomal protein L9 [Clostridia bacterium]